MKKQPYYIHLFLILLVSSCLFSCKSGSSISHQDSLKIKAWDQLFSNKTSTDSLASSPFDQPVHFASASDCIKQYGTVYGNSTSQDIKDSYTYAVSFQSKALGTWLGQVTTDPKIRMDEVRICFGLYTPGFTSVYATAKAGRLTVFLWPYYKGKTAKQARTAGSPDSTDVDPFNLGSVYP